MPLPNYLSDCVLSPAGPSGQQEHRPEERPGEHRPEKTVSEMNLFIKQGSARGCSLAPSQLVLCVLLWHNRLQLESHPASSARTHRTAPTSSGISHRPGTRHQLLHVQQLAIPAPTYGYNLPPYTHSLLRFARQLKGLKRNIKDRL